ncbi:ABC transporter C-terminal domain-containing protein [Acidicapsa acidisoli]|uniref:ABC transporter C-terminal domain-containing protein n=1 Tax=Acidicapsa acidisoli TaxID=1615681 RepID=UPI0021E0D7E5|nr:ABC transporter C-terminal domain-containing protein [Acidicapsa acidisoli]
MPNQVIQGTLDIETSTPPTAFDALTINVRAGIIPSGALEQSNYIAIRETAFHRPVVGGPQTPPPPPIGIFSVRASDGLVSSKSIEAEGIIKITGPNSPQPFNVLTVNAASFAVPANLSQSYFIIASDIGAAPPNGLVRFSVRADGLLSAGTIQSPTIDQLQQRIDALEAQIQALTANSGALSADITGVSAQLNAGLGELQGQVDELSGQLSSLSGEVSSLETRT